MNVLVNTDVFVEASNLPLMITDVVCINADGNTQV